jgi:hypothetical protein
MTSIETTDIPQASRLSATMDIGKLCEFVSPITNVHINSLGAMLHEVRVAESLHWFEGLHCAELFIKQQQEALQLNWTQQRRMERQLATLNEEIALLELKIRQREATGCGCVEEIAKAEFNLESNRLQREVEAKQDRAKAINFSQQQTIPMVRDTAMIASAAIAERERILNDHPEALGLDFLELQRLFAGQIIKERQGKYIAARTMGLSETAAAAILDVPEQHRQEVFRLAGIHRSGVDSAQALSELAATITLGGYGESATQQIVAKAAEMLNPPPVTPFKRLMRYLVELLP